MRSGMTNKGWGRITEGRVLSSTHKWSEVEPGQKLVKDLVRSWAAIPTPLEAEVGEPQTPGLPGLRGWFQG